MGKSVTVNVVRLVKDLTTEHSSRKLMEVVREDTGEKIENLMMFTSKKGVVAVVGKSYTGYLNPAKDDYPNPSFSICWQVSSQDTPPEPVEEKPIKDIVEVFDDPEFKRLEKNTSTSPPDEPESVKETYNDSVDITHPLDVELRLHVAEIIAQLCNRYSEKTKMTEFVKMCKVLVSFVETGE